MLELIEVELPSQYERFHSLFQMYYSGFLAVIERPQKRS